MAWLLIRAFSDDKPTAWQIGDIVEVRPDDCKFGNRETLPRFYRIKVNGLDHLKAKNILESPDEQIDEQINDSEDFLTGNNVIRNRVRKYRVNTASLPRNIRSTLLTIGEIEINYQQIKNHIRNNFDQIVEEIK